MPRSASWPQPREGCDAFHDFASAELVETQSGRCGRPWPDRRRSGVQLPQVAAFAVPSGLEPVRMSCRFGSSPRPLMTPPVSDSAVCLVMPLPSPCRASTLAAIVTPCRVDPGTGTDAVARVDALRAEVGRPGLPGHAGSFGKAGAMGVGALQPAEIGAVARTGAGHEEAHGALLRRRADESRRAQSGPKPIGFSSSACSLPVPTDASLTVPADGKRINFAWQRRPRVSGSRNHFGTRRRVAVIDWHGSASAGRRSAARSRSSSAHCRRDLRLRADEPPLPRPRPVIGVIAPPSPDFQPKRPTAGCLRPEGEVDAVPVPSPKRPDTSGIEGVEPTKTVQPAVQPVSPRQRRPASRDLAAAGRPLQGEGPSRRRERLRFAASRSRSRPSATSR